MEFLGTKGEWKVVNTSVITYSRKICDSRINNQTESRANLLLISKAPEMLEMLKYLIEDEQLLSESIIEQVTELINEATKIKQK